MVSVLAAQRVRAIKTEGGRKNLETQYTIEMLNITKRFPGIIANDNITLRLKKGEIHALLGENGAGKSTLMSVLFGLYQPEEGEIHKDGRKVEIRDPNDANALGIGMVHQHFKLIDVFTVLDNIILGAETTKLGFIQRKEARKKVEELSEKYGLKVDLDAKVEDITVGMQQRVEILKMLYRDNEILIFDEPTAVLTPQETDKLFAVLRSMRDDGKAIVIITHKMHEVETLSDRVAVLRHGQFVGDMLTKDTNAQEMTNMMVGHAVTLNIARPDPVDPKPRIEVKNLTVRSIDGIVKLDDVSFTANSGEILGIAGISGCGQKELLEAIAGLQPTENGSICYVEDDGTREELLGKDPLSIAEMGVALSFVPEDRLGMGLVGNMDLSDNMMLRSFRKGRGILTDRKSPRKLAETVVEELDVNTPGVTTPVRRLSGGNVQKVLVGRELAYPPPVLLTADAVRGSRRAARAGRPHPRALRRQGQRHRPRPRRHEARRRHDDDAVGRERSPCITKSGNRCSTSSSATRCPGIRPGASARSPSCWRCCCARSSRRCAPTSTPSRCSAPCSAARSARRARSGSWGRTSPSCCAFRWP